MFNEKEIVLMHKSVPVASFSIDADEGYIISEIDVINHRHLPIPVQCALRTDTAARAMRKWVANRSIPDTRNAINDYLRELGVTTPSAAAYKSLGLNLSDQYWYKPTDVRIDWHDVNLFENNFPQKKFQSNSSFISPDSNSNGELPKFWRIENGKRLLYKQGTQPFTQQPYNEVFASRLLERLSIPHVDYFLNIVNGETYSVCATFVDANSEYIPAGDIIEVEKKVNHQNAYQHFFKCAAALKTGISERSIDNMLIFDNLINNVDRHYGNLGFIRDADTLKFQCLAPIFDNGNSLWYNVADGRMTAKNQPSKPFAGTQDKQLALVKHSNLPLSRFTEDFIYETAHEVYSPLVKTGNISEERIENLIRSINYKVMALDIRQNQNQLNKNYDS